ncbi:MAG: hypothetical protein N2053_12575, partial [Chitinispirillaceae bacterium]|nr:hypothetical protein [Chitinispirillaceae bacterium]
MKKYFSCLVLLSCLVMLCAPYKQLQPKPEVSSAEGGYIELKRGKKEFSLKKGKKYFIFFPAPMEDHFYIVLSHPQKKIMTSYLVRNMINKKLPGEKVPDESETDTPVSYT